MRIKLMCFVAAVMLTGCVPQFQSDSQNDEEIIYRYKYNDFQFSDIADFQKLDTETKYEHLSLRGNVVNEKGIDKLILFSAETINKDYTQYLDSIGRNFLGDSYQPSKWKTELNSTAGEEYIRTAVYSDYELSCTNFGEFVFSEKEFDFPDESQVGINLPNGIVQYRISADKNFYIPGVQTETQKLIWKFDDALNMPHSALKNISSFSEKGVLKFNYLPAYYGLTICNAVDIIQKSPDNLISYELEKANKAGQKAVYVNRSFQFCVTANNANLHYEPLKEYDTAISIDSVLNFIDDTIAGDSYYEVKRAEMKYLLTSDTGTYNDISTVGVPVWEILISDKEHNQVFMCLIDAVSGEYSFVRVNGYV